MSELPTWLSDSLNTIPWPVNAFLVFAVGALAVLVLAAFFSWLREVPREEPQRHSLPLAWDDDDIPAYLKNQER